MKFIKYILETFIILIIFLIITIYSIIIDKKDTFHSSYQSIIQDKYRLLKETNEPKIILVGGSNLTFGINQKMIEEATGYKVVNLGLHAGFGNLFVSELAKENINKGDIVLLGYEYGWEKYSGFEFLSSELVMSGIDNHIEMYKYIPLKKYPSLLGYLFKYAEQKNNYVDQTGEYCRKSFDSQTTQMILNRDYVIEKELENGLVEVNGSDISKNSIQYLKKLKKFIESKNAQVYFIAPVFWKESFLSDKEELKKLKKLEEKEIGIKYISNPTEYLFEKKYFSNSGYHCNNEGEIKRTEMLINDLFENDIIK